MQLTTGWLSAVGVGREGEGGGEGTTGGGEQKVGGTSEI